MMGHEREELQSILEEILGSKHVYFQPPESLKLTYPAIIYHRTNVDTRHANDRIYKMKYAYELLLVSSNPDNPLIRKLLELPLIRYERSFSKDNLTHDVFQLYY